MDDRTTEALPQRTSVTSDEQLPLESRSVSVNGSEFRIDRPHASVTIGQPAPKTSEPAPHSDAALPAVPRSTQLQRDAGRFFEQMQLQLAELTEREAAFEEREQLFEQRLADFEAEQARLQHARARHEAELEERRIKLGTGEAELAQRLTDTRALLAQIESARLTLELERADVEGRRASIRDEVLAELQEDRHAVERSRDEVAQEHHRARTITQALEDRLREATAEAERLIQGERERLWQTLIGEWEERRSEFQRDHDAWLAKVQTERLDIEREKAFYEAAVRNAEKDFTAARTAQEEELGILRAQQIAELQAERIDLEQSLTNLRAQVAAEQQKLNDELLAEKQKNHAILLAERQAHAEKLNSEREALNSERDEWNKARSLQLSEIHGERAVLENRIRFQQEHLEKLRSDLERAQNEHRRERQIERQRLEDDSIQLLRRMRQIDLYRSSVDEREKSLERERQVLEKTRRAMSNSVDQDRLALQREQSAWQAERQIQQGELLRQQELYTTHMDSLESRRIRMEKLRAELEDTHRSTLEMRLAVEEAWVELTQAAGQDVARERVEQVRNTLVGYYRQLHEGLVEQRREHLESQTKFERLRAEFHDERQKLMEWISSRDADLRSGEERLRLAAASAASRDLTWQSARDRWMQEKAEAEQVIRKLLGELGNQHRDPAMSLPSFADLGIAGQAGILATVEMHGPTD